MNHLFPSTRKAWFRVFLFAVLIAGLVDLATFLLPPVFRAQTLLFFKPEVDPLGLLNVPLIQQSDPMLNSVEGLLQSHAVEQFAGKRLGIDDPRKVDKLLKIEKNSSDGQLVIATEHKDDKLCLSAVQAFYDGLIETTRSAQFSTAKLKAGFYDEAIKNREKMLKLAEDKLIKYSTSMTAPSLRDSPVPGSDYLVNAKQAEEDLKDVNSEVNAKLDVIRRSVNNPNIPNTTTAAIQFQPVIMEKELELAKARNTLGPLNPKIKSLEKDLASIVAKYRTELNKYLNAVNLGIDPSVAESMIRKTVLEARVASLHQLAVAAPKEAVKAQEYYRAVQDHAAVLTQLMQQYELARIAAQIPEIRWAVVDPPYLLDKPINKEYIKMGMIGFILGAGLALVWRTKGSRV